MPNVHRWRGSGYGTEPCPGCGSKPMPGENRASVAGVWYVWHAECYDSAVDCDVCHTRHARPVGSCLL